MRIPKVPNDPNPQKAERDWPPVVVGGGYYTGLLLMRNLARRGVTACCVDSDRDLPAFRSVYGPTHHCPSPDHDPAGWLEFMVGLARKLGRKPVLIPSADRFVSAMSAHARELEEHFTFHHEGVALQGLLATKQRQYELADEHGMPVPRTRYIQSQEEVEEFATSATFPCLLKPLHGREWVPLAVDHPLRFKKLITADTPGELVDAYRMAAEINPKVVVQEIIEGPDSAKVVSMSCYGRDGELIASCMVRELRTHPINYGSASVVEPVSDPEVSAVCDRFLRSLGYRGLCEIELKRDSRDGRVKMIEANPRYSATSDAAPYAGVDLGWIHYLDLIGQKVSPVVPNGRSFRHIFLHRDFASMHSYRHAGLETRRSLIRSYLPPVAFYDFDIRDWRVSAGTLIDLARIVVGPTLRKIFPKRRPGP